MCANEAINGVTRDGGYAEYVTLRTEAVARVPKEVDPAAYAPILCAGITVFNSLRNMKITAGDVVAVQGLGGLGHLALQYANKMGYKVVAISSSSTKEKFARDLGAHEYIDGSKGNIAQQLQDHGGAACIILTAPNAELVPTLIQGLAPLGRILVLAVAGPVEIPLWGFIQKATGIVGWPSGYARDSEDAIDFARRHGVNCLIEKFKLDQANEAFQHMLSGKVRFRAVLVMDE
jgi:D-arabinose 1-dehydrogenase-like Zn-dependent alcohol dehydrogenase